MPHRAGSFAEAIRNGRRNVPRAEQAPAPSRAVQRHWRWRGLRAQPGWQRAGDGADSQGDQGRRRPIPRRWLAGIRSRHQRDVAPRPPPVLQIRSTRTRQRRDKRLAETLAGASPIVLPHARMLADAVPMEPDVMDHARGSYFFCRAPGGVMFELNSRANASEGRPRMRNIRACRRAKNNATQKPGRSLPGVSTTATRHHPEGRPPASRGGISTSK